MMSVWVRYGESERKIAGTSPNPWEFPQEDPLSMNYRSLITTRQFYWNLYLMNRY